MAEQSQIAGLFMTPEQYQQTQDNAAYERAAALAQMDPFQAAKTSIGYGAYKLGGAIGGALGAQDPMLQRQAQRRALIQQIDMSNPDSLVAGIRQSANDPELSAFLMGKYKDLVNIQKEQSVIDKNKAWEASKTDSEKKRTLLANVEQDLQEGKTVEPARLNQARLAWAQETKPKQFQQPDGTIVTVPGIDPSVFPQLSGTISKTSTSTGTQGGGATGNTGGGSSVANVIETPLSLEAKRKQLTGLEEGKAQLTSLLGKIDDTEKLIGPTSTGWGQKFLGSMPGTDAMTLNDNTQVIKANLALTKLQELKNASKTGASGLGTVSDRDMATIKETIAGLNPLSANYKKDLQTIREFFVRAQKAMDKEAEILSAKTQEPNTPKPSGMSGRNPQIQPTEEALIERNMNKNPGHSRQAIINELIKAGKLPQGYGQ
jgi:hypothetical protein